MPGVLTYTPHSPYDDVPARHYHLPERYHAVAARLVGEAVVYYRPGEGARHYFATARVRTLEPDPVWRDTPHHYLVMEPGSYRAFARPVPARLPDGTYLDSAVEDTAPRARHPLLRRAVRWLAEGDFKRIAALGGA